MLSFDNTKSAEMVNVYKQTDGPDYKLSSLPAAKSGSYSLGVSPLKGGPTRVDNNCHPNTTTTDPLVMKRGIQKPGLNLSSSQEVPLYTKSTRSAPDPVPPLKWDWDIEHEDRKRERKADASFHHEAHPFEVDRRLLKDVVREKMGLEVGRIKFLSAGTFHKAYLVVLVNHEELVARVARRFMPRLKIESEVATMSYLRERTNVSVPKIYHYDSNPFNRLGGEFILMSKAPGIPLSHVYHGLAYNDLVKLVKNLARIMVPLFAHRFTDIGSLYFGPDPRTDVASGTPTPQATQQHYSGFPFSPTLGMVSRSPSCQSVHTVRHDYHVGPIISWPFFGSNRGGLVHPTELNRGPWPTCGSYLDSCVDRETKGVVRENEGRSAPHRLHLDPDDIRSSRHHRLKAVPGDESDDSDEYNMEESDEESEGPGDTRYLDFRRMQRGTFLVAHTNQREQAVRNEMTRWKTVMERLIKQVEKASTREQFALDCHDLSLENVFVDPEDHTKITCIIDWESTTTRPLWACAHLPSCIQSSPFVSNLFRSAVRELATEPNFRASLRQNGRTVDANQLCREWLYYEAAGARLRMAHRCAEWDGWEEGLVDSILGPEEFETEWFKAGSTSYDNEDLKAMIAAPENHPGNHDSGSKMVKKDPHVQKEFMLSPSTTDVKKLAKGMPTNAPLPFIAEQQKERLLNQTGDICGGRGGELGLRLEAWLSVTGGEEPETVQRWNGDEDHLSPSTAIQS